jgi:hypothetical protein
MISAVSDTATRGREFVPRTVMPSGLRARPSWPRWSPRAVETGLSHGGSCWNSEPPVSGRSGGDACCTRRVSRGEGSSPIQPPANTSPCRHESWWPSDHPHPRMTGAHRRACPLRWVGGPDERIGHHDAPVGRLTHSRRSRTLWAVLLLAGISEGRREVAAGVENAPDVDLVVVVDVEDEIREARDWPGAKLGDAEFVREAQRTVMWVPSDLTRRPFDGVDESHRDSSPSPASSR